MLDARQLGLKLIANVTYGYTAANFSGRMPCIEVNISMDTFLFKKRKFTIGSGFYVTCHGKSYDKVYIGQAMKFMSVCPQTFSPTDSNM